MIFSAFPVEEDIFAMPSRSEIEKLATELLNELYLDDDTLEVEVSHNEETGSEVPTVSTFAQNLKNKISLKKTPKIRDAISIKKSLKSEMQLFEATNGEQRGECLSKLFLVLKNIAPTSIACERAFSIATSFIPKVRSLLSDEAIDDLCFEKGYFANEKLSYN